METNSWVKALKQRIQDKKCVICGNDSSVSYNSFPICRQDDIVLARRIQKAESYGKTEYEKNISTAREICIDSPNLDIASSYILVEYGGFNGLINSLLPQEVELLRSKYPEVMHHLKEWDSV
jgi:hypothetical protein